MDSTGKKFGNVINNRLIQEWLCLHDIAVKIDGIFGPVTKYAVRLFQSRNNLKTDGIVGLLTHAILTDPVRRALKLIRPENSISGKTIMAYAYRHLEQRPREIGGQNRGPWVRLYMGGIDGLDRRWCAGFVSFIVAQACRTLGTKSPVGTVYSCNRMASDAKRNGLFVSGSEIEYSPRIPPGSIFLQRSQNGWNHTGFVIDGDKEVIRTIEGNAAPDRTVFGDAVCESVRNLHDLDFIFIGQK